MARTYFGTEQKTSGKSLKPFARKYTYDPDRFSDYDPFESMKKERDDTKLLDVTKFSDRFRGIDPFESVKKELDDTKFKARQTFFEVERVVREASITKKENRTKEEIEYYDILNDASTGAKFWQRLTRNIRTIAFGDPYPWLNEPEKEKGKISSAYLIVKEAMTDNTGISNEIHLNDVIQEKLSLSERLDKEGEVLPIDTGSKILNFTADILGIMTVIGSPLPGGQSLVQGVSGITGKVMSKIPQIGGVGVNAITKGVVAGGLSGSQIGALTSILSSRGDLSKEGLEKHLKTTVRFGVFGAAIGGVSAGASLFYSKLVAPQIAKVTDKYNLRAVNVRMSVGKKGLKGEYSYKIKSKKFHTDKYYKDMGYEKVQEGIWARHETVNGKGYVDVIYEMGVYNGKVDAIFKHKPPTTAYTEPTPASTTPRTGVALGKPKGVVKPAPVGGVAKSPTVSPIITPQASVQGVQDAQAETPTEIIGKPVEGGMMVQGTFVPAADVQKIKDGTSVGGYSLEVVNEIKGYGRKEYFIEKGGNDLQEGYYVDKYNEQRYRVIKLKDGKIRIQTEIDTRGIAPNSQFTPTGMGEVTKDNADSTAIRLALDVKSGELSYVGKELDISATPQPTPKEDLIARSIITFGTTTNPNEAGYILEDGTMLDFSEKNDGGELGIKARDHREIEQVYKDTSKFETRTAVMEQFLEDTNAVRVGFSKDQADIDIVGNNLTNKQLAMITKGAVRKERVNIDYYNKATDNTPSKTIGLDMPNAVDIKNAIAELQTKQPEFKAEIKKVQGAIKTTRKALTDIKEAMTKTLDESDPLMKKYGGLINKDAVNFLDARLKKHQKLLRELKAKKVTKASFEEVKRLMRIKNSMPELKAELKKELKAQKEHQKEVATKKFMRKLESKERTEFLNLIKEAKGMKKPSPHFKKAVDEFVGNIDTEAKSISVKKKLSLDATKEYYESIKKQYPGTWKDIISPNVVEMISRLEKVQIKDMTVQDVIDSKNLLANMMKQEQLKKEIFYKQKRRVTKKIQDEFLEHTSARTKLKTFDIADTSIKQKKPIAVVSRLVGIGTYDYETFMFNLVDGHMDSLLYEHGYKDLNDALHTYYSLELSDNRLRQNIIKGVDTSKWYETKEYELPDYGKVKLSEMDKMNFYLHNKAQKTNITGLKAGYTYEGSAIEIKGLTTKDIKYVIEKLTGKPKEYADMLWDMQNNDYYTDEYLGKVPTWRKRLNEQSMRMDNFEIATEKNHMRIVRNKEYLEPNYSAPLGGYTRESYSMLKDKSLDADQGIIGEDMLKFFDRMVHDATSYSAYAEVARNIKMIFNREMLKAITKRFNPRYEEQLKNYLKIVDGNFVKLNPTGKFVVRTQANIQKAIMFNYWMWINQLASIPYASSTLDPKYIAQIPSQKIDKAMFKKHTPTLDMRRLGFTFLEVAEARALHKYQDKKVRRAINKLTQIGPAGVIALDTGAIDFIVKWAMAQIKGENKGLSDKTDEFWKKVADLAVYTVESTQPNFTWLHRPYMRITSSAAERITMPFMTVLLKTRNMLAKSYMYNREAGFLLKEAKEHERKGEQSKADQKRKQAKDFKRKSHKYAFAIILGNLAVATRNYFRNKSRGKKVKLTNIIMDLMVGVTSMIPVVRDVYYATQGYDIESPFASTLNTVIANTVNLGKELLDTDDTDLEKELSKSNISRYLKRIMFGMASFIGIGVEQFERDFVKPTLRSIDLNMYYDYSKTFGQERYVKAEYYTKFFDAVKKGDTDKAKQLAVFLFGTGTRTSNLRSSAKTNDISDELRNKAIELFSDTIDKGK